MTKKIPKDLKNIFPAINGDGRRRCISWIESFVEQSDNLESSPLFRKWSAISALAATLEQKVWLPTSAPLYPHLYVFLVGHAGIGKTRSISAVMNYFREMPDRHIAPTSMTMASMVDCLVEAKRHITDYTIPLMIDYNTLYITADELSAFMHEYSNDLIAGLTKFYDVEPYGQARRTKDLRVVINRPQLNILCGTTPSNLVRFIPEYAWEQGFTSRVIMVYSDQKPLIDIFNSPKKEISKDMLHDLNVIDKLNGAFGWTEEFAKAMHNWKLLKFDPVPTHPKLRWYCERRETHMLKLSMIASVDRKDELMLTKDDFNRAFGWLTEAELFMPDIFRTGAGGIDAKAMDEIMHFVQKKGQVPEHALVRFAKEHVPAYSVVKVLEIMVRSGMISEIGVDKIGMKIYGPANPS